MFLCTSKDEFEAAIHELARLNNLPLALTGELMVSICDTPETDESSLVIAYARDGTEYGVLLREPEDE